MKTTSYIKQILAVTLLALMVVSTVQARSWRIHHNVTLNPDFTDINAAMTNSDVAEGDTLYLDPGCSLTTDQTITKQVTVVGCGYFRSDLPYSFASVAGKLYVSAIGAKVESLILNNQVIIRADNVTIERCKADQITVIGVNGGSYLARNAVIRQCWVRIIGGSRDNNSANCTIENCIVIRPYSSYGGYVITDLCYPIIRNNYIYDGADSWNQDNIYVFSDLSYSTIVNNIIINESNKGSSHIYLRSTNPVDINYNLINNNTEITVNESTIFALTGDNDERYQLKNDSHAKGYAADGGDIGPFGGLYPYVIGGLPAGHPYYTKATIAPRSNNDKVKVSLQIKMQDE